MATGITPSSHKLNKLIHSGSLALDAESFVELEGMLAIGELEAISHQRTRDEFLEARRSLYQHDAQRYPNYFTAAGDSLIGIKPTIEKTGGTTSRLASEMFRWASELAAEQQGYAAGPLIVAPSVLTALSRRENEAITYAYFRKHMGSLAERSGAEYAVRRKISVEFTQDYLRVFDADLATGVSGGLDRFDRLARSFPAYDIPLLGLVLYLSGLRELLDPATTRSSRWSAYVEARPNLEHSLLAGTIQCLLLAMKQANENIPGPVRFDESEWQRQSMVRDRLRTALMKVARRYGNQDDLTREHPAEAFQRAHRYLSGLASRLDAVTPGFWSAYEVARSQMMPQSIDVLLVTAVDVEADALAEELAAAGLGSGRREFGATGINSYYFYGPVGGATIATIRSSMGSGGSGGSHQAVADAVHDLKPSSVIAVGIAFGIDRRKTPLGTVLISNRVFEYDPQRISTVAGNRVEVRRRGPSIEASPRLLDRFRGARLHGAGIQAKEGIFLSGTKLIDNVDYRNELLSLEPEAIGGEMEGAGLWAAAARRHVDWIIAKAVCDFADGRKKVNKAARQKMAARNAALAVIHVLQGGGLHKFGR